ncbi:MAG: hypothetical protein UV05_C0042G0003 [candidate division CPR1 bacterium GW2011_GWA2_42_17]|uniref:Glycosyltransferase RgtA/B/C/D-like domain-containing protein n=1 Tax=candidate division CPR1 bacterium GW2011_GWA2_42_17 TaxID=1618341 RepID=A0A0G1BYJ2_9BACT|nr:MAG: hypothetical protein UV05_C0042G0003 [candidate division CPR1 bacterium GW2011_GWA2_42_17]
MKLLKSESVIVLSIILLGLTIRLVNIGFPLLEYFPERQTQTAEITRNIYKNGWPDFWAPKVRYFTGYPIPYVLEFPLYNGIVAGLYYLFGPNVIWGRIMSLIFFSLSGIVFYKLVKRNFSQGVATLSTFFFSLSPLGILVSRTFQPESLLLLLFLLSLYYRSFLIFSLTLLVKFPIIIFSPLLFITDNQFKINIRKLTKLFLSISPILLWIAHGKIYTTYPGIAVNYQLSNWFDPKLYINPRWYFSLFQIEHIWVFTTLGLVLFWIGLWRMNRKKHFFWFAWLVNFIFYFIIFNRHAAIHEYYHLLILPPASASVGLGLHSLIGIFNRLSKLKKTIAVLIFLIVLSLNLISPALRKILASPTSPGVGNDISPARYQYIEDF